MKNTTASASDIFDGDSEPQMPRSYTRDWHLAFNGNPHFMRIFRVFKTGQPAASRKSRAKSIPRDTPHPIQP
jgi:hypothetical protein